MAGALRLPLGAVPGVSRCQAQAHPGPGPCRDRGMGAGAVHLPASFTIYGLRAWVWPAREGRGCHSRWAALGASQAWQRTHAPPSHRPAEGRSLQKSSCSSAEGPPAPGGGD